ncbi:MAG: hypothetical protein ACRDTE_18795 [Pseudonocardiaceae bacterium]
MIVAMAGLSRSRQECPGRRSRCPTRRRRAGQGPHPRRSRLRRVAADLGEALRLIECTCRDEIALARIDDDRIAGSHPAANRDPPLYRGIPAIADPISPPKLVVDTGRPLAACVAGCLRYLAAVPGDSRF